MITLTLPLPPSTNRMYRLSGNRLMLTAEAKNYKLLAGWTAVAAGITPLDGRLWVCVNVYNKTERRNDIDNNLKLLFDGLNQIAWNDDRQIVELHVYLYQDKRNPRVELKVERLGKIL